MLQNSLNNYFINSLGNIGKMGYNPKTLTIRSYAAGDNIFQYSGSNYVVPAGKIAILRTCLIRNNNVSGLNTFSFAKYDGSTAKRCGTIVSSSFNSYSTYSNFSSLLIAGESLAVKSATTSGDTTLIYFTASILEMDEGFFTRVFAADLSSGSNLIYTCPANKNFISVSPLLSIGLGSQSQLCSIADNTSTTFTVYLVPNGETLGSTHKILSVTTTTGTISTFPQIIMSPGDKLYVESSSSAAGQNVIINGLEV